MSLWYEVLPIPLQNAACTFAGWQRARTRFTPHFHRILTEWDRTGRADEAALIAIQRQRLDHLVRRAREHTRFWKDLPPPSEARDATTAIRETLASIPPLDKATYRVRAAELVADDIPQGLLQTSRTSGTTGTALPLWYTPRTSAEEYATVWRMRRACGVELDDPHLTFGGQAIVPLRQEDPPFWRTNYWGGRQTLFSLYHMKPENLPAYVEAIHATPARYVQGYPSSLHLIGRAMLAAGRPLPKGRLVAVFTSSESLLAFHRDTIEAAFGAPVHDRYGTSEFAVSMTGCPENHLHVDMEFSIVEVEPEEETDEWVRGPLLVTGLANEVTPFLRYRIGDVGTRSKRPCPCGRAGDVFLDIDGRIEDYVVTPDGRWIGRLDHIFKGQLDVAEAQIRQHRRERIDVLVVPYPTWRDESEEALRKEIRSRLGDEIEIGIELVEAIPREANGKFRAVLSAPGSTLALRRGQLAEQPYETLDLAKPVAPAVTGMRLLSGDSWNDGYLDYHLTEDSVRIQVASWANLERITGQYFERPKSIQMLLEYLREFGPGSVMRKVRSRLGESLRNEKYLATGIGTVIERRGTGPAVGTAVAFVAPSHPRCVERIVLSNLLVREIPAELLARRSSSEGVTLVAWTGPGTIPEPIAAWHPESGRKLEPEVVEEAFERVAAFWGGEPLAERILPLGPTSPVAVSHGAPKPRRDDKRLTGVIFGLGNYAKTNIIPCVKKWVDIRAVHELDPTQIGRIGDLPWAVSTSPVLLDGETFQVHFVAGYHHTHADQAIVALESGAIAVVEKPAVTDPDQLARLLRALEGREGRLFSGYHMRHNPLFALAREDLRVGPGEPISICSDVFEVALPARHWYRWPNARSHVISNGCHWIDQFLFMNDYSRPRRWSATRSQNGDSVSQVELENGASLVLHLTHLGSPRIGVQNHVVMRARDRTVTVSNGSSYLAEGPLRVLRRTRINRMQAYSRMYRQIAQSIAAKQPGDSLRSLRVLNELVLELDEALCSAS
ncbi:MAG: hypothetical protein OZ948_14635 [Deltaproteobacteria bacterium]|nr:hypothetical protein [Deltaproteobacteria bacterium]